MFADPFDTTPSEELERWMHAKRAKTLVSYLTGRLENARRRRHKKILVPLDTVERILALVHYKDADTGEIKEKN